MNRISYIHYLDKSIRFNIYSYLHESISYIYNLEDENFKGFPGGQYPPIYVIL